MLKLTHYDDTIAENIEVPKALEGSSIFFISNRLRYFASYVIGISKVGVPFISNVDSTSLKTVFDKTSEHVGYPVSQLNWGHAPKGTPSGTAVGGSDDILVTGFSEIPSNYRENILSGVKNLSYLLYQCNKQVSTLDELFQWGIQYLGFTAEDVENIRLAFPWLTSVESRLYRHTGTYSTYVS